MVGRRTSFAALLGAIALASCADSSGGGAAPAFDSGSSQPPTTVVDAAVTAAPGNSAGSDATLPSSSGHDAAVFAVDSGSLVTPSDAGPSGTTGGGEAGPGTSADAGAVTPPDAGTMPRDPKSAGCSAGGSLKSGDGSGSVQVGGVKRDYLLHVPQSYDGSSPVPLLLDFHPLLMDAAYQRGNSGYAQIADQEGFIVAYPQGVDPAWNVGPCCTQSRDVDDVGFAKALVEKLENDACVDVTRVYAAGYSNGGGMAHLVACDAADVFAAVAPAAFDLLEESEEPCHPARPISVLSFRSTNDAIVPYAGGASDPPTALLGYTLPTIHFLGAEGTFMHWGELDQCTGTPEDTGNNCKTYSQCAAGVEVSLCTSATAGHATGPADQGWAFLKRFTLP